MFSLIVGALLSILGFDDNNRDKQPSHREKPISYGDDIVDVDYEVVND